MVPTRLLHFPLSQLRYWKNAGLLVTPTRQSSSLRDQRVRKKGQKTVKSFADLPSVYVNENGVTATPLPEWSPTYLVPPADSDYPKGEPKAKRKGSKRKKVKGDEQITTTIVNSANKVPKRATFLAREIFSNLRRFPHCLLLTRVGSFYESYFNQAVEISRLLSIKLTSRKWNGERVAMCGFPIPHLDRYLKVLVQQEQRFVALCEEFVCYDSSGLKEFERRISRIVTPGTLIDESFLDPCNNNYLLAVKVSLTTPLSSNSIGLAWIDISTGEFFSKECIFENLKDELARLAPREVVLDESMKKHKDHPIVAALREVKCLVSYCASAVASPGDNPKISYAPPQIQCTFRHAISPRERPDADFDTRHLESRLASELCHDIDTMPDQETSAIKLLTSFLQANLLEHMPLLNAPRHEDIQDRMQIDAHTIQGLEIREVGHEGIIKGSLLSVVKRTLTSGGTRLLSRWLCSPSTSIVEINNRQSLVSFFHRRQHFRADICGVLKEMDDVSRLCQRFLLGRADFNDLIAIKSAIGTWKTLKQNYQDEKLLEAAENRLCSYSSEWASFEALLHRMHNVTELYDKISQAIIVNCDSAELSLGEDIDVLEEDKDQISTTTKREKRWTIDASFSRKLSDVHAVLDDLTSQKEELEKNLQSQYDCPSLTLRSSTQLGMFVHLSRGKRDRKKLDQDPMFYCIGESLSTKSYFHRNWTQLGSKITEATIALNAAEKEVFDILRLEVIQRSDELRQNAHIVDELDVAISFANLAEEMNFVRPKIVEDASYTVVNGRHPSVEMGLLSAGRQFTPNSVEMSPSSNLHVITGPNMAGKSTFLRQTALIAILAQVGSFVPADYARIGLVDKLFSRIGAKDDLYRDRSTFMVEMLETAEILRRATERSLIIMDEVGRGTTVKDGLAIAFASLHHIATVTKSRCLFATHFHELAEMLGNADNERGSGVFPNVRFYCSDVDEVKDSHFAYSYRLQPGINRDSHGLKVAYLAGMPSSAMEVATDTLSWLRTRGTDNIQSNYKDFLQSTLASSSLHS